jgi:exosortase H (IPTLxxWG-CTERM-specific)
MERDSAGVSAAAATEVPRPEGARFRRFVLLFVVVLIAGNLILLLPAVRGGFVDPWTGANAAWAARIAGWLGLPCETSGILVRAGRGQLAVKPGCNGVHALLLCLSAVLAYPAAWPRKLLGVALATVGVFGLNLIRLVNLFFVADRYPERLEFFHVYVWQTLIGLLAFGIFLLWGRFLAEPAGRPSR